MLPLIIPRIQGNKIMSSTTNSQLQVILLSFALYLVKLDQSEHKPAFRHLEQISLMKKIQRNAKPRASSFFNWWYFGIYVGLWVAILPISCIQEILSWCLRFGIPCTMTVIALVVFLVGTPTYKHTITQDKESPFLRIGRVFVAAFRNWREIAPPIATDHQSLGTPSYQSSEQFNYGVAHPLYICLI